MISDLSEKVIIVTGGSGGIGSAIVNQLSDSGVKVISTYYHNRPVETSEKNILWVQSNLINSEDQDNVLSFALRNFGKIDVLVNCAGVLEPGNFLSLRKDKLKEMIDLNLTSVLMLIQKTLVIMKEQGFGHIVNIGSLGAIVPMPYSATYCATKFALRGFSFSLSEELKGTGINFSLVTPGSVKTKMLKYESQSDDSAISFTSKPISPSKVANAVLKVIKKPRIEIIVPYSQSIPSKLLAFSPALFSKLYKILHRMGIAGKKKYKLQY
ncbi:MAG: SDR family oxidoreductase [Ignavibacterium sp.]|jgi:short-subunit dehydrogenase|nr:SDR family oxidoreductase [Ignavibacterium sp.]